MLPFGVGKKRRPKCVENDVLERNNIKNELAIFRLATSLCSSIGSLTNPVRIANTLESVQKLKIDSITILSYITILKMYFCLKVPRGMTSMGITKPIKILLYLHWFEKCAFELPTVGTGTYHGECVVQLPPRTRLSCGCWNCGIPRNEKRQDVMLTM